jgi:hypothetical protein
MGNLTFDPVNDQGIQVAQPATTANGSPLRAVITPSKSLVLSSSDSNLVVVINPAPGADTVAIDWGAAFDKLVDIAIAVGETLGIGVVGGGGEGGGDKTVTITVNADRAIFNF